MKDIFIDAITARLAIFFIGVFIFASYAMEFKKPSIVLFFIILFLVLQLFKKAINIANFEMSNAGRIVQKIESKEYAGAKITWYK